MLAALGSPAWESGSVRGATESERSDEPFFSSLLLFSSSVLHFLLVGLFLREDYLEQKY